MLFPTSQEGQEHLCSSWEEWLARKHGTLWIHFRYVQIAKPTPSCLFRPLLGRGKVQNAMKQRTRPRLGCWVDQCWSNLNTKGQRHMKLFLGPHRCFDLKWTWNKAIISLVIFRVICPWFWCSEIIAFVSLIVRTFAPVLRTAKSSAERNTVTPSAHQQFLGICKLWSFVNFWGNETNWCVESNRVFCQ